MSGSTKSREIASSDSGTLSPNPWDLTLSRQNVWCTVEGTRTEDRDRAGRDPRGASRAEIARDGFEAGAVPKLHSRPRRILALLRAKNGLDNGVHFTGRGIMSSILGRLVASYTRLVEVRPFKRRSARNLGRYSTASTAAENRRKTMFHELGA